VQQCRLPETLDELSGHELERVHKDPWGTPYVYERVGEKFQIRSCGPDRIPGGGDDVDDDEKS
jgi:hypothetical protein